MDRFGAAGSEDVDEILLENFHPEKEGSRTGVIILVPAVRKIFFRIDRIAYVPFAVWRTSDQVGGIVGPFNKSCCQTSSA